MTANSSKQILGRLACATAALALTSCAVGRQQPGIAITPIGQGQTGKAQSANTQPANTQSSNALAELGDRLLADGKPEAALQLYRRAGGSPAGMADALRALGRPDEALTAYHAAGGADKRAALGAGGILLSQGRTAEAEAVYQTALTAHPGDGELLGGRALALEARGEHAAALEQFRAALAADPDNRKLRNNYGLSLAIGGDYPAAFAELEKLARDPATTQTERQTLALAYALGGHFDAAEKLASVDLGSRDLAENLAHYRELQAMSAPARVASILGAPSAERQMPQTIAMAAPPVAAPVADEQPLKVQAVASIVQARTLTVEKLAAEKLAAPAPVMASLPQLAAPAPAAPLPPAQTASTGWSVQLAAYRSSADLDPAWRKLSGQYEDLLGKLSPRHSTIDLGQRSGQPSGVFHRLAAAGLPSRAEAAALCAHLQTRGQSCIVRGPGDVAAPMPSPTLAKAAGAPVRIAAAAPEKPAPAVKWTLVGSSAANAAATGANAGPDRNDGSAPPNFPEGQAQ